MPLILIVVLGMNSWKRNGKDIPVDRRSLVLMESNTHMDVYRLECDIPLLLNFYYVDEAAEIPLLDYGQVVITTLKTLWN